MYLDFVMREINVSDQQISIDDTQLLQLSKELVGTFVLLLMTLLFVWSVDLRPSPVESTKEIVVGPIPDDGHYFGPLPSEYDHASVKIYDFKVHSGFGSLDIWRSHEFSQRDFQDLILRSIPKKLRSRVQKYLPIALKVAHKYQVDPFWVLAVMWTESHFNEKAKSHVKARGLMQIMPGTSKYLAEILDLDFPHSQRQRISFILNVNTNIEMGVFYLKKLLKMFKGNYVYATVAYNMGPGWVLKRLKERKGVGVKNKYLVKVRKAYKNLGRVYKDILSARKAPYETTFVNRFREEAEVQKRYELFPNGIPVDVASNEDLRVSDHIIL
ncbi:MAG: lytic transglycosylase domain-containing protein [Bacteriovoracaceae bacterium]